MHLSSKQIAIVGLTAALYAGVTISLAPLSYGPIQVRVAEALTVLPYINALTIPGLFIGCLTANIFGGFGLVDILGGSSITLLAAMLTRWTRKLGCTWLAPLPPVVLNATGVSLYLHLLAKLPYWLTALYIAVGELLACYFLGLPLLILLIRRTTILKSG